MNDSDHQTLGSQLVPECWYGIAPSRAVTKRKAIGVKRFGRGFALWRGADGNVTCLPDRCSHRAAILSTGKILEGCLECPYHGLRFDKSGRCVLIPANGAHAHIPDGFDITPAIVREAHGLVWYWYGEGEPAAEIPWLPGATELDRNAAEYNYEPAVPYLRVLENLADFHHFPILHKTMIPGVGTRMDQMDVHMEGNVVAFAATMRYENPRRPETKIQAWFGLPSLALIKLGNFLVNYVLTPVDEDRTWVYARYEHTKLRGTLGRIAGTIAGRYDRAILELQDKAVLQTQVDEPGDFSRFKLYEADRALALFWGLRKRAIVAARNRRATAGGDTQAAAAGG